MGERYKRIPLSLPVQMLTNLQLVVSIDGRSQAEIIRSIIGSYIDAKMVQAQVLRNMGLPSAAGQQASAVKKPASK